MSDTASTRRTPVLGAFLEGWRRVSHAPMLMAGLSVAAVLLIVPLGFDLFGPVSDRFGIRTMIERAVSLWHGAWALALIGQSPPPLPTAAGAFLVAYVLRLFLLGGILDRLARGRPVYASAFFGACGVHFWRFLRLGLVTVPVYWALYHWLYPYVLGTLLGAWTTGVTDLGDWLTVHIGLHFALLAALTAVSVASDFAMVRTVVEDRHSALGSLAAGLRFIRRRPLRIVGLTLLNVVPAAAAIRLWHSLTPEGPVSTVHFVGVLILYVVMRVYARTAWLTSEVVFFQGELAHATYTAAPAPMWPDSPAAEAMANLKGRGRAAADAHPDGGPQTADRARRS